MNQICVNIDVKDTYISDCLKKGITEYVKSCKFSKSSSGYTTHFNVTVDQSSTARYQPVIPSDIEIYTKNLPIVSIEHSIDNRTGNTISTYKKEPYTIKFSQSHIFQHNLPTISQQQLNQIDHILRLFASTFNRPDIEQEVRKYSIHIVKKSINDIKDHPNFIKHNTALIKKYGYDYSELDRIIVNNFTFTQLKTILKINNIHLTSSSTSSRNQPQIQMTSMLYPKSNATIYKSENNYFVSDAASKSGTRLNVPLVPYLFIADNPTIIEELVKVAKANDSWIQQAAKNVILNPYDSATTSITTIEYDLQDDKYLPVDTVNEIIRVIMCIKKNAKSRKRVVLCAPPGVGKTRMMFKWMHQGQPIILMMPRILLIHQGRKFVKKELPKRERNHDIIGFSEKDSFKDQYLAGTCMYMTYNKALLYLDKNPIVDLSEYIYVIDEVHALSGETDFRYKEIKAVFDMMDMFDVTLMISATPEYINYKKVDNFIVLKRRR